MTRDQILDQISQMAKADASNTRACYEWFISEVQSELDQYLDEQYEKERAATR